MFGAVLSSFANALTREQYACASFTASRDQCEPASEERGTHPSSSRATSPTGLASDIGPESGPTVGL